MNETLIEARDKRWAEVIKLVLATSSHIYRPKADDLIAACKLYLDEPIDSNVNNTATQPASDALEGALLTVSESKFLREIEQHTPYWNAVIEMLNQQIAKATPIIEQRVLREVLSEHEGHQDMDATLWDSVNTILHEYVANVKKRMGEGK